MLLMTAAATPNEGCDLTERGLGWDRGRERKHLFRVVERFLEPIEIDRFGKHGDRAGFFGIARR